MKKLYETSRFNELRGYIKLSDARNLIEGVIPSIIKYDEVSYEAEYVAYGHYLRSKVANYEPFISTIDRAIDLIGEFAKKVGITSLSHDYDIEPYPVKMINGEEHIKARYSFYTLINSIWLLEAFLLDYEEFKPSVNEEFLKKAIIYDYEHSLDPNLPRFPEGFYEEGGLNVTKEKR